MKAIDIITTCEDYFHGFQDVVEHKDLRSTIEGIVKILSYIIFIIPCVFALTYYKYKNVKHINTLVDNLISLKVDMVYNRLLDNELVLKATQKDLIDYLVIKVQDIEMDDPKEIERFKEAFYLLEPDSQVKLFSKCISNDQFSKTVDLIPRDIKKLHFNAGADFENCSFFEKWDSEKNGKNAKILLTKLSEFTELQEVDLNFKGLGPFTPGSKEILEKMTNNELNSGYHGSELVNYRGSQGRYCFTMSTEPIMTSLVILGKFFAEHPNINYTVSFMGDTSIVHKDNRYPYAQVTILNYFEKQKKLLKTE